MELDEMREAWAADGAALERRLAVGDRALRAATARSVRRALAPYAAARAVETLLAGALAVIAAAVVLRHGLELVYLVAGTPVAVVAGVAAAHSARLFTGALRLDLGAPVVAARRGVERLRVRELHALEWALLGGVLVWLPAALILVEAVTGAPALAGVDGRWLAANLAFGVVVLAAGRALSRRHVDRPDLGPRARRLVDVLSGRGLRAAARALDELARFEAPEEEPADGR